MYCARRPQYDVNNMGGLHDTRQHRHRLLRTRAGMKLAVVFWIFIGAIAAFYLARVIRVWIALRDLREWPNVIFEKRRRKKG